MPVPIGPIIAAGAQLASSGLGAANSAAMNKKTRKWNEKMYDKQRADSLFDYNSQNTYNSPEEQMKRLKAAGLNPNLVYDNGAATAQAAPIRSTDVKSWNPETPQFEVGSAVKAFYDTKQQKAQTDNFQKQLDLLEEQKKLTTAQVAKTDSENKAVLQSVDSSAFKLKMDKYLEENSYALARGSLELQSAQTDKAVSETSLNYLQEAIKKATSAKEIEKIGLDVVEAMARIDNMQLSRAEIQARIKNLGLDSEFKRIQNEGLKKGYNINDPWYMKQLQQAIDGSGIRSAIKKVFK